MMPSRGRFGRAVRGFVALGMGNYSALAVGLLINLLLARRLGAEEYGRLALLLTVSQVLLLVAVNWTHAGFVRFGAQEHAARGTVSHALWARLGILAPAVGLGVLGVVAWREPLAAYLGIAASGIGFVLLHFAAACAVSLIGAILQASDRMSQYGLLLFVDKAIMLAVLVLLPTVATPVVVLACYAASSCVAAVWGLAIIGLRHARPVRPGRALAHGMMAFSLPLMLSSWAGLFGTSWLDLVILKWYVPLAGVGVYSLATQLAGVIQQVTIVFSTLLLPHLSVMVAERQDDRLRTFIERLLPYWILGATVACTVVVIAARPGVPWLFGNAFADTATVIAVLMAATTALALFNACAPLLTAYGSTWALTAICLASAGANVVLNLVLIPSFGLTGSAVATALAYGLSAVCVLLFVQRRVGSPAVRLAWLSTPVLTASLCAVWIEGPWFYVAAPAAAGACLAVLIPAYGLFSARDTVFLRELPLPAWFAFGGTPVESQP